MQKEIIEKIQREQKRLQRELKKESPELTFLNSFLQKINFSKINTYNNVSIEELITAYVKSTDSIFSLEEIQEIAGDIVPIFEKCTSDEIHAILSLIDDFTSTDNYEDVLDVLYSDSKIAALEELIESVQYDPDQEYVEKAARIMEKEENEKLIDFISIFHANPDAWGYALLLVHVFYQIKESQEDIKRMEQKNIPLMFPILPKPKLEDEYEVSKIVKITKKISMYQKQLTKEKKQEQKAAKKEIEDYNHIIEVLNGKTEEIEDYKALLTNINNPYLRLEILKEIYRRNQAYYEKLDKKYTELVENSEVGYESLCQRYHVTTNVETLMKHYSYKELEGILSILKELGVQDMTAAIKNTNLKTVKAIVELIENGKIGIEIVKSTPSIWDYEKNYPERINTNANIIERITGSNELYKRRSAVNLIDSTNLQRNLTVLKKYELLGQLGTTTSYHFLQQEELAKKIDLVLELGKEEELTHNLGLLNYSNARWQRLEILRTLNIPVEESMLEGLLHTDSFLVPDSKIEEYLDKNDFPGDIVINPEEIKENSRTYTYREIPFSKNKVIKNYLEKNKNNSNSYIDILFLSRQYTAKEISIMRGKQNKFFSD